MLDSQRIEDIFLKVFDSSPIRGSLNHDTSPIDVDMGIKQCKRGDIMALKYIRHSHSIHQFSPGRLTSQ